MISAKCLMREEVIKISIVYTDDSDKLILFYCIHFIMLLFIHVIIIMLLFYIYI